jgi:hypothetical protein
MAIWQFDLFLVREEHGPPLMLEDGWQLPQMSAASTLNAQRALVKSMGYPWLMMEDWVVFGSENSTRVDLFYDGADEVEIRVRIDASATDSALDAVCTLAGNLNSRLFDPATHTMLRPDRSLLASALAESRAAKFSQAPRTYMLGDDRS